MNLMQTLKEQAQRGRVFRSYVLSTGVRVGVRPGKRVVWEINGEISTASKVQAVISRSFSA